jgi:NAD(P)-dependent dehydrogenase (short-subunit alcohol dehydrogenase family)
MQEHKKMDISGKTVVVTGGASGLGEATVEHFVKSGARVAIFDRDISRGEMLAAKFPGRAIFANVNVVEEVEAQAGFRATMEAFGSVHVCVNCAGVPGTPGRTVGKAGPMALAGFAKVIEVNLIGTFNICRLAAAEMIKNDPLGEDRERGVIVNTSSLAGIEGQMGQVAYASSKAGVIGMMLPMVRDLSQFGIRVCTIAPGLFDTPMAAGTPPEVKQMLVNTTEAPKRLGRPAEFASLAAYIVENKYLNGELIRIDAGTRAPPR